MTCQPIKVIIADNSSGFTEMLRSYLSLSPDIEIIGIAENGHQVLALLGHLKPDVLLLDLVMPDMDGMDVLRHIIAKKIKKPLVIILSGLCSDSIIRQAIELGADYFFEKPFNIAALVKKIRLPAIR